MSYWLSDKFCSLPKKIGFWPKSGHILPDFLVVVISGQTLAFLAHPKNHCERGASVVSDMWVPKLLVPLKNIRIFGPNTAILAPKRPFWPKFMYFWTVIALAGSFGAVLGGCFLVVERGLLSIECQPTL